MVIPDLGRSESIPILYMQERLTALLEERKRMGEVPAKKPGSKGALRFGHKVGDTISKALSCHHNAYSHLNGVQQNACPNGPQQSAAWFHWSAALHYHPNQVECCYLPTVLAVNSCPLIIFACMAG